MLFNSFDYLLFAVVVLVVYWVLPRRSQNAALLGASLFFYGVVDPRLLGLILLCAATGYGCGLALERNRQALVPAVVGVVLPLAVLGVFKYFDFFLGEFDRVSRAIGLGELDLALELVLPVGISFYTFQTIGYVIDVRRGDAPAERGLVEFFLFVTFFPQLVAGPIERASHLIPQIRARRVLTGTTPSVACG